MLLDSMFMENLLTLLSTILYPALEEPMSQCSQNLMEEKFG
jgi:hypothetical protein